jgi:uncharacterized protein
MHIKIAAACMGLLLAPSLVFGAPRMRLDWQDNSDNENGFGIERKQGEAEWTEIARRPMDTVTHHDNDVLPGETYCYRVFAFNTSGQSPYSNEACASVKGLPNAPTDLTITVTVKIER